MDIPDQDEEVKTAVTGSTQTTLVSWGTLAVAILALLIGVASGWIAGGLKGMLGSTQKLNEQLGNFHRPAQSLSEIVLALANQVSDLKAEVDYLKGLRGAPHSKPTRSSPPTHESGLFHSANPERQTSSSLRSVGNPPVRVEPRIAVNERSIQRQAAPYEASHSFERLAGGDAVVAEYRAVLQARGPDAMTAFINLHSPLLLTVVNDAIVRGDGDEPDYLWLVRKPEWGDRGLLLPGGDAIRSWATTFQPSGGRAARNLFGRAYDVQPDNVLQIDDPAVVEHRGKEYAVLSRGRLRGA